MSERNQFLGVGAQDCESCPLGRREFLRELGLIAGALAAVGIAPGGAAAMPVSFVSGIAVGDEEKSYPIPAKDGAQIDKGNAVIVMRAQNTVFAFSLACPHQNTAIRWHDDDHQFECPKHHSKYRADGTFIEGRATRGLDRFAVRKDGNNVVANLDKLYQQDKDEAWKTASISV